jgi:hypothetical protein
MHAARQRQRRPPSKLGIFVDVPSASEQDQTQPAGQQRSRRPAGPTVAAAAALHSDDSAGDEGYGDDDPDYSDDGRTSEGEQHSEDSAALDATAAAAATGAAVQDLCRWAGWLAVCASFQPAA